MAFRSAVAQRGGFLLVLALASPPVATDQGPPQAPQVLRSRVSLVSIDVYVMDPTGRPVADLRREDFTVLEDGVRQEIAAFATYSQVGAETASPAVPSGSPTIPAAGRTFLFLLGRGRLEEPSKGLTALRDFIGSGLNRNDRVALLAYGRASDASAERAPVLRLLERFRSRHERIELDQDEWFTGLTLLYGSGEIPQFIRRKMDAVFDADGLPSLRELPLIIPPTDVDFEEMRRLLWVAADPDRFLADTQREYNMARKQDLEALYGGIEYLRFVDGQKHLVYVTEDPPLISPLHMTRLTQLANDAGVSIWPLQTGGAPMVSWDYRGRTPTFVGPRMTELHARAALHELAEGTGGRASVHKYAISALEALESGTRFQYLLGYYPPRTSADGRHHEVVVRVSRKNLDVRHRSGYFARQETLPTNRRQAMARARIIAAGQSGRELRDIPLAWRSPAVTRQPGSNQIVVRGAIDASGVAFNESDGVQTAALDVAMFALDTRGEVVGEAWQPVDLRFSQAELATARGSGISIAATILVAGEAQVVRFVVYQYATDKLGSITTPAGTLRAGAWSAGRSACKSSKASSSSRRTDEWCGPTWSRDGAIGPWHRNLRE